MNYYNPFFNYYPYMNTFTKPSLLSRIFGGIKGINFSSIVSGTGKTLNVINQTIPLVKQVKPVIKNAKTMFKVMNEFKRVDAPITDNVSNIKNKVTNKGPTFFL